MLSDTFSLSEGELIALQVRAAQGRALCDTHFEDLLRDGSAGPALTLVPAGAFEYGAVLEEAAPDSDRPRRVGVIERDFALGTYPLTTEEFEHYAAAVGWQPRSELVWLAGRKPVINVRQTEAIAYCGWLSAQTGHRYRLPTELEWEYACRAGAATVYPTGDRITSADALYNTRRGFDALHPGRPSVLTRCFVRCGAADVGERHPNRWGLHDMMGNVWEFTATPWSRDHVSAPERPRKGVPPAVVTKGGSWFDGPEDCRPAARRRRLETELDINLGFRVVRELD